MQMPDLLSRFLATLAWCLVFVSAIVATRFGLRMLRNRRSGGPFNAGQSREKYYSIFIVTLQVGK